MALGPIIGQIKSSVPGHAPYDIRLGRDHRVYCSCPAWKYSKGPTKTCKHLKEFNAAIVAASKVA